MMNVIRRATVLEQVHLVVDQVLYGISGWSDAKVSCYMNKQRLHRIVRFYYLVEGP